MYSIGIMVATPAAKLKKHKHKKRKRKMTTTVQERADAFHRHSYFGPKIEFKLLDLWFNCWLSISCVYLVSFQSVVPFTTFTTKKNNGFVCF